MIDIPKITAEINTKEAETVELPPIVATIETKENFVELPKVVADIRPEKPIVGNLGTMVAGKGKDGKDGVDGRHGKDGIDGKPGRDGIDGKDGKDGKDGITPRIGENGNWFIDDFDTGVCAVGKNGLDGVPGKDGYTPRLGIDYFNGKDGRDGVDGKTPVKGLDYFDGQDGKDGKNGRTPIKGIDYKDGKDGKNGLNGLNGTDGFSPKVLVEEIEGGHKITITDKDGKKSFNVMDGQGGNGDGGTGENGFSPKISVEEIENGHRITITDIDGTKTIDVLNGKNGIDGKDGYTPIKGVDYFDGKDGQDGYTPQKGVDYFDGLPGADGQPGKDGYSPVRGTDYWTPEDIQIMVTETVNGVLAQKAMILEVAYPVGAIYMSTVSANPQTLFGFGTWERIQDRFLLAAGSTYAAGNTGGTATHTHEYRLGVKTYYGSPIGSDYDMFQSYDYVTGTNKNAERDGNAENPKINTALAASNKDLGATCYQQKIVGNTKAETNMPPYLAVYVWKRTA